MGFSDHVAAQAGEQLVVMPNGFSRHADEDVADHQAAFFGGTVFFKFLR